MKWALHSWRKKRAEQQVDYRDQRQFDQVLRELASLPPLVGHQEVDHLREAIGKAQRGEAFLLQGGDCAERFIDCAAAPIEDKLRVLLQMSLVLTWGARLPVLRVGRIAGQYAKPRSKPTEIVDGVELPIYRGDHVNGIEATLQARAPDPKRMLESYFRSAATLNYARSLAQGGFSDLHRLHEWDHASLRTPKKRSKYFTLCERVEDALAFMECTGASQGAALGYVELFSSHEALCLNYESTQSVRRNERWYNLGAHFLWVGERSRQLDGAHVEYLRGIHNPIGIKVGPTASPSDLLGLLDRLNPDNEAGRITLITRVGHQDCARRLAPLVRCLRRAQRQVLWICDPMHGNTQKSAGGVKTRHFPHILAELQQTFATLNDEGAHLGGVHLEISGADVTECTGGPQALSEADLCRNYQSYCDPRLNFEQSLELAFFLADLLSTR